VHWASHAFNRPLVNINHKIYQITQRQKAQALKTAQPLQRRAHHVFATLQNMRVPALQKAQQALQNMRVPALQKAQKEQKASRFAFSVTSKPIRMSVLISSQT